VITAGIIDIMAKFVTDGTKIELTDGLFLIFVGVGIAILGRLVFDIIRERVESDVSSSDEKLTIDE
jgi:uncharacterized membrane protein YgaE (UPF0421/DUF939 family)